MMDEMTFWEEIPDSSFGKGREDQFVKSQAHGISRRQ